MSEPPHDSAPRPSPALRALVVDDEAPARRRLVRLLEAHPDVDVRGTAADAFEALTTVAAEPIDLLLLDVNMPEMDGTRLADKIRTLPLPRVPMVVMVTAHPEHAVQAFDLDVVDYVLKPPSRERVGAALERVRRRRLELERSAAGSNSSRMEPSTTASGTPGSGRLVARTGGSSFLVDPDDVGHLRAEHKYVVASVENREFVFDESLNALEAQLADRGFVRVHRAQLVNLAHVVALHVDRAQEGAAAELELRDGTTVPVSRRRLPALRRKLDL